MELSLNARSVGMMHTLPIRREGLFLTNLLSGLTMMAIPYAVTGVLTVLVTMLSGSFEPVGVLVTILGVAGESVFFFGLATFCAFIVGNVFMLPALYTLFNFLAVLTDFMVNLLAQGFCFGLTSDYSGTVEWLSPVVYLMQNVCPDSTYETRWITDGATRQQYESGVLTSVRLEGGWLIAVYAAAGLVLLGLAWLLYRRRRSESAGDVVAVGWMKPVFRYGCAAYAAILGGRLLYALFWESFQDSQYFTLLPMILCMIVGGAVGYYAASMLLAKTPRVFKTTWKGLLAVALGCIALCCSMKYDVFGVERRVPAADGVKMVNLYAADSNYYLTPGKDDDLIAEVRALHQAIIDDKDYIQHRYAGNPYGADGAYDMSASTEYAIGAETAVDVPYDTTTRVRFTYTLNSGLKVERQYDLPLTRQRTAQEGTYDYLLDQLINSPEMRQKRIRRQDEGFEITNSWLNTYDNCVDLSSREVNAILDAVAMDAESGSWGLYDWFDSEETGDEYDITVEVNYKMSNSKTGRAFDQIVITVRKDMTETVRVLKELGLITDRDLLTRQELYPWQYMENGWQEYDRVYETFGVYPEEYRDRHGEYPEGWFGTAEPSDPAADDSYGPSMSAGAEGV